MKKFMFYIKQLFPMMYFTKYSTPDGGKHVAIWRQWFGVPFSVNHFNLAD